MGIRYHYVKFTFYPASDGQPVQSGDFAPITEPVTSTIFVISDNFHKAVTIEYNKKAHQLAGLHETLCCSPRCHKVHRDHIFDVVLLLLPTGSG